MKADTKEYDANIQKARKQLERFGEDNLSAGGVLKQLSGNLIGVAAKFASFGAAASAAMKLAKDAFFNNEQQLDEWGRVVQFLSRCTMDSLTLSTRVTFPAT